MLYLLSSLLCFQGFKNRIQSSYLFNCLGKGSEFGSRSGSSSGPALAFCFGLVCFLCEKTSHHSLSSNCFKSFLYFLIFLLRALTCLHFMLYQSAGDEASHPLWCVRLCWFSRQCVEDISFLQCVKLHHPSDQMHLTQVCSFGPVRYQSPHLVRGVKADVWILTEPVLIELCFFLWSSKNDELPKQSQGVKET